MLTVVLALVPGRTLAQCPAELSFDLTEASIRDMQQAFAAGTLNSEELVQLYLDRIEAYDKRGPRLNSIIALNPAALATARALDAEREASGPRGPLHGIPILLKDNFDTSDMPTTAGSLSLKDSIPPDDAYVTRRLRESGAVILGKTNLPEFAFAYSTVSTVGGESLNPYDTSRTPGGSSGGTGAAIAANLATVGTGSDTAGSIRVPSSYCGLVGLKPTLGLTSRDGLIPLFLPRDVAGPMARSVADVAIVLDAIAGFDPADPITELSVGQIPATYTDSLDENGLNGARIGVACRPQECARSFFDEADPSVVSLVESAVAAMKTQGAEIVDSVQISKPRFFDQYYNSFRYDMNNYLESLGPDAPVKTVQEIIELDLHLPYVSVLLFTLRPDIPPEEDDPFLGYRQRREGLQAAVLEVMATLGLDAVLYPSVTHPAHLAGRDPAEFPLSRVNSNVASFTGYPAISVPAGLTSTGLPVGIEFLGRPFAEPTLIRIAYSYEQATQHRVSAPNAPPLDCNANGVPDGLDLMRECSLDCNRNRIPDECDQDCDADGIPDDCEVGPTCPGDCDADAGVSVDELVRCVNIILGSAAVCDCLACDANMDGNITIAELIQAVNSALAGCSIPSVAWRELGDVE